MFSNNYIHSSVSNYGHLKWNIITITPIVRCIWIFFFLFPFIYEKQCLTKCIFAIITLVICFINYKNDNTISSMWCWSVNSIFIYYAFYLLIYLPFLEKQSIC